MMIDTIVLYIFLTLTLIQGHRIARKSKFLRQVPHKVFYRFDFGVLLRLVGVLSLIFMLSGPVNIHERKNNDNNKSSLTNLVC